MVRLNELTINNLVQDLNENYWVVINLDKIENTIICKNLEKNEKEVKKFKVDQLNYIKLTKDWLRRFRFTYGLKSGKQKISEDGWFSPAVSSDRTNLYKIQLKELEDGGFCNMSNYYTGYDFLYVHELQNWIKLMSGREMNFLTKDMKKYIKL